MLTVQEILNKARVDSSGEIIVSIESGQAALNAVFDQTQNALRVRLAEGSNLVDFFESIDGTADQITVTDGGDGTVTLALAAAALGKLVTNGDAHDHTAGDGAQLSLADCSDYETGLYTPTLAPAASGSVTVDANNNTLSYIKLGPLVHVFGNLVITGISSPTGTLTMSLPFTAADLAEQAARVGTMIAATRVDYTTDDQQLMAIDAEGSAVLYFYLMTKEAGFTDHIPSGNEAYYINYSYYAA